MAVRSYLCDCGTRAVRDGCVIAYGGKCIDLGVFSWADAVAVHFGAGSTGVLAVAFFANDVNYKVCSAQRRRRAVHKMAR
jgi:hypothetical protein